MNALHSVTAPRLAFLAVLLLHSSVRADPLLSSWFTAGSTKYARIYKTADDLAKGNSSTTWTGQTANTTQSSPTYAGVHEISYSPTWVYIRNSGLAPYIMGPWNNPNLPRNQGTVNGVYRFPRTPTIPTGKTLTGTGSIGFLVDGVSIYNTSDGFSYSLSNSKDADPITNIGKGDEVWNRDAWPNEFGSFDFSLNHPQPSGQYHAHANPIAVRYLLGDNINYDSVSKKYSEITPTTAQKHSPIIGWINDGFPLYGPYGYSNPYDASSGVRRMVSGYVLRDGSYRTDNLNDPITGRRSLPAWAQAAQTKTFKNGPAVSTSYALGHYAEDYDYLGDHGYTQEVDFDLNKYNARYCVTPEFPNGTWAYFTTITSSGAPWYPYNVGRWYYGSPTAGNSTTTTMNADKPLITYYKGATSTIETWSSNPVVASGSTVTLSWNAVEGGTYEVSTSTDLSSSAWTPLSGNANLIENIGTMTDTVNTSTTLRKFYKFIRIGGMADYDSVGY